LPASFLSTWNSANGRLVEAVADQANAELGYWLSEEFDSIARFY